MFIVSTIWEAALWWSRCWGPGETCAPVWFNLWSSVVPAAVYGLHFPLSAFNTLWVFLLPNRVLSPYGCQSRGGQVVCGSCRKALGRGPFCCQTHTKSFPLKEMWMRKKEGVGGSRGSLGGNKRSKENYWVNCCVLCSSSSWPQWQQLYMSRHHLSSLSLSFELPVLARKFFLSFHCQRWG